MDTITYVFQCIVKNMWKVKISVTEYQKDQKGRKWENGQKAWEDRKSDEVWFDDRSIMH